MPQAVLSEATIALLLLVAFAAGVVVRAIWYEVRRERREGRRHA